MQYEIEDEAGVRNQEVIILNGRAAERPWGAPRPTTRSTIEEWLQRLAPPPSATGESIKVLLSSAGVYTMRMAQEVQQILQANGRNDILIVPAGAAPEDNTPQKLARMGLDEMGRLICRSPSLNAA